MKLLGVLAVGLMLAGPVSAQTVEFMGKEYSSIIELRQYLVEDNAGYRGKLYLAGLYRTGKGGPKDYEQALSIYLEIAEDGYDLEGRPKWFIDNFSIAQNNLGVMYANGEGVPQDDAEAVKWYRLAAEQGYAKAQSNLGVMYGSGRGVLQDDAEAAVWYRKAAEQGYAIAQLNLGTMYEYGSGVLQDAVLAHLWYNIGGANGLTDSSSFRNIIETRMTREQIADAQALARRCMASNYQDCG